MTTDVAAVVHEDAGSRVVSVTLSVVVALAVGAGTVPAVNSIAHAGVQSARQFWVRGGDLDAAFRQGIEFAVVLAVLVAILGSLPLLHIGNQRRFLLPGWGIGLAVVLVMCWVVVMAFLAGIGGMGGPYADPPAARLFGRSLYDAYPAGVGLLAVGMLLLQAFLRHVEGRAARGIRVLLPPLVAVAAGVTVVALTVAARALHG